jgi:hypothetical protein
LDSFFENYRSSTNPLVTFSKNVQVINVFIASKIGLGDILGDFSANFSGHPAPELSESLGYLGVCN